MVVLADNLKIGGLFMDYKEMNQGECDNVNNKQQSSCKTEKCRGGVIENLSLSHCSNEPVPNFPNYKIPVVISEFTVQIDVESKIKLAEPALEIKRIRKNVFLTECRLIGKTSKVFISGFVRKNIEYATVDSHNDSAICGDIKHTTIQVPFHCVTELKDMRYVAYKNNPVSEEAEYWDQKNMGKDMKEMDLWSEEYFNEKVYCELVHSTIHEADIIEEYEKIHCHPIEHIFKTFIEKEVICLKIKLLQNQQVYDSECSR